jgi:hypothetical protein
LQAKYNQLQLENSIILQREQDLLLDSCKQSDEKEEVEVSKVMKGIVKNQEKKSKRKSSTGTNKTQVKKKMKAKVTEQVEVAAKDTPQATATIEAQIVQTDVPQVTPTDNPQIKTDWEIPAYWLKKTDEKRLPLIDGTRREEIVVVLNHRKERNKTGEFLIAFGSGENFWASMASVVKDIDKDTLKRYLTRNELTLDMMRKQRKKKECMDNGDQTTETNVNVDTNENGICCTSDSAENYLCKEDHDSCLCFYAEGNPKYAAPNMKMHGIPCNICKKQFASNGTIKGESVPPGKKRLK